MLIIVVNRTSVLVIKREDEWQLKQNPAYLCPTLERCLRVLYFDFFSFSQFCAGRFS